jgi:hypothetical protein
LGDDLSGEAAQTIPKTFLSRTDITNVSGRNKAAVMKLTKSVKKK